MANRYLYSDAIIRSCSDYTKTCSSYDVFCTTCIKLYYAYNETYSPNTVFWCTNIKFCCAYSNPIPLPFEIFREKNTITSQITALYLCWVIKPARNTLRAPESTSVKSSDFPLHRHQNKQCVLQIEIGLYGVLGASYPSLHFLGFLAFGFIFSSMKLFTFTIERNVFDIRSGNVTSFFLRALERYSIAALGMNHSGEKVKICIATAIACRFLAIFPVRQKESGFEL